jgi:hypothetical protein
MPRFEVKQPARLNLTSYSGVALIGQCCQAAQVEEVIDPKLPILQGMKTSYLALLRADSGFDSVRLLFAKAAERDRWAVFMPKIARRKGFSFDNHGFRNTTERAEHSFRIRSSSVG